MNEQSILNKIAHVARRFEELERQMADPLVLTDHVRLTELAQERSEMQPLVEAYHRYQTLDQELADAEEVLDAEDGAEMVALFRDEAEKLQGQLDALQAKMKRLLIPKDRRDESNVFIEIRAGAGGDEAAIFAADLARMYMRYAEGRGWKTEIVDDSSIGVGGYKEVILAVRGRGAFSRLKFESGVHRVQRVPTTESQGRIHTSTATVAVMPEIDDVEVTLDERDLDITATFSSGPGGQHMQKNATAARIVHRPSGISVKVQTERSLTQNKRVGMQIIQARLQQLAEDEQHAEIAADRKSQVGTGDRAEKIRTYNYPQNRVSDHRIGLNSYNLSNVVDGDLDEFIDGLTMAEQAEKLASLEIA
jgi:peptide chain release factor 1